MLVAQEPLMLASTMAITSADGADAFEFCFGTMIALTNIIVTHWQIDFGKNDTLSKIHVRILGILL